MMAARGDFALFHHSFFLQLCFLHLFIPLFYKFFVINQTSIKTFCFFPDIFFFYSHVFYHIFAFLFLFSCIFFHICPVVPKLFSLLSFLIFYSHYPGPILNALGNDYRRSGTTKERTTKEPAPVHVYAPVCLHSVFHR